MDNYLKPFKNEKTKLFFIYENEYIDQHYLDDYSSYHVRCFKTYKKTCARIHLFCTNKHKELKKKILNKELNDFLNKKESIIKNDNYLGFIVIRPIPENFFAKVCLKPYYENDDSNFILTKDYKVSLFGYTFHIKSIAFQEQDKIISACATTSLWSFFHAHPMMNLRDLPSSNKITRSSYGNEVWESREFPNKGLSPEMISKSLKMFNLSPEKFEFKKAKEKKKKSLWTFLKTEKNDDTERVSLFKEYIYAYCSSRIPLILGVTIYDRETKEKKGMHAVTVLGYHLNRENQLNSNKYSDRVEKIYVHDDRYGPYLKIDLMNNKFEVKILENNKTSSLVNAKDEIYETDIIILGVYHKIRVPYIKVFELCETLVDVLKTYVEYLARENQNFKEILIILKNIEWDVKIKENRYLKEELLESNIKDREKYLTKSFPKYIWSATAKYKDKNIFELIFDATDIQLGNIFLDYIKFDDSLSFIIEILLKNYSKQKENDNEKLYSENIKGIFDYFTPEKCYKENLADLYGYLNIPRNIKENEISHDNIVNQCEMIFDEKKEYILEKDYESNNFKYLWVIDRNGFLRIGKEKTDSEKGHPTLTGGKPARIGGELEFDIEDNTWVVNPFSGRYSDGYEDDEKKKYLNNAIVYKFNLFFNNDKFKEKEF
ncbi:hypothetical protein [Malaciobacter pacificus]|uniref:hypothetical protein n=1 Tax=Malaciobacter pacificus TaxID=1080223 RepID=UPI00102A17C0|nr:hypothetical protein [Malaciobacter pacificus]